MSGDGSIDILTAQERDTLCEMTSIAMGAAGATLGLLLGSEVETHPPAIQEYAQLADLETPFGDQPKTLIAVQYTRGIHATSVFVMKNADIRRLAGKMLGSMEEGDLNELSELELGAAGELMNQMLNSAATGLASVIQESVAVQNPEVLPYSVEMLAQCLPQLASEPFIAIEIRLLSGVEEPIELLEFRLASEVRTQVDKLMSGPSDSPASDGGIDDMLGLDDLINNIAGAHMGGGSVAVEPPSVSRPSPASAPAAAAAAASSRPAADPVMVRPVEFGSFDHQPSIFGEENKNLDLVLDVGLNLCVELGKTELSIKEVLELTRGSVIELNRIAGEPVDLMANGRLIAKGEVVVIEDNFGLRITSIISPAERLKSL